MIRHSALIAVFCSAGVCVQAAPASEGAFIAELEKLPNAAFTASIEAAFKESGCVYDFSAGEDPLIKSVATHLAATLGYTGAISQKSIDVVDDLGEDAIDAMMENGNVIVDRAARTARLKDCK